ncbi:hypothetical protein CJ205_04000 [Dolosicoccus paucivorans]|uniref:HD domain-containing protein n=1 Tax=Dolosicoccus paucivorans TaxID=84521 RepID=A0A2N6SN70_9LACT|nr:HD domain-containing protein [Dolosicoccus paucivorans]PMB84245.1 hypothetical protein CJ206_04890 [Dolosicoccus paucivorans]PMC58509.1 hypothetical protein CJ205_04000 [Dolosicoccus paucivorans]
MSFIDQYNAQKLDQEKVFRDPVHDYIYAHDELIMELINTKEFQRLRRIKQLGTTSFTFHGAEHSRFNHSLGVYEITRRIIDKLSKNIDDTSFIWNEEHTLVTLCAALLHDIGHGPFSHIFEGIFNTNHEAITQEIILSPQTEVHQVLLQMGECFPKKVAQIIDKSYPHRPVIELISSQIDADRMDYLLRDAYYTGVSYGKFDLTRILQVIRVHNNQIVFDFAGMHAIEDYIVSRYQMYMQVYFHPVSRGMEELLKNLLKRGRDYFSSLEETGRKNSGLLAPFLFGEWTLDDYLALDDSVLNTYFTLWLKEDDPVLQDLAYRFLSRKPFKSILVEPQERKELKIAIDEELNRLKFNQSYYFGENSSYDLPYDYYHLDQEKVQIPIELLTKDQKIIELSQVSALVDSLTGKERGDHRLFFPREILQCIHETDKDQLNDNQQKIYSAYLNEHTNFKHYVQQRLF